jgi:hypothetical protein
MGLADSVAGLAGICRFPGCLPARRLPEHDPSTLKLLDQRRLRRVDLPDDAMDAMASVIGGAGAWGLARLLKKVNQSRCPMRVSVVGREADLAPQR